MLKISTILTIHQMASDAIKELKQAPCQPHSEHQTLIDALVDVRDISASLGGQLAWQQALKSSSAPEPASEPAPAPAPEPDPLPQPDVALAPGVSHQALLRLAQIALPEPASAPAPASKRATTDDWLDAGSKAVQKRKPGEPSTKAILSVIRVYATQPEGVMVGDVIKADKVKVARHLGCSKSQVQKINRWLKLAGLIRPANDDNPWASDGCHWILTLPDTKPTAITRPDWLACALKSLARRKTGEADPEALKAIIGACARLAKWQGADLQVVASAATFAKEADISTSTAIRCIYWLRSKGLASTKQAPTKQKPIKMTLTMPGGAQ